METIIDNNYQDCGKQKKDRPVTIFIKNIIYKKICLKEFSYKYTYTCSCSILNILHNYDTLIFLTLIIN